MQEFIPILFLISPIVFFIGIFNLFLRKTEFKLNFTIFIFNLILLIYLFIKSYNEPYIEIFYGIFGIIGFVFTLGGIINYYRINPISKEERINFAIYLIICLIIGFGMCSTTGIFGF